MRVATKLALGLGLLVLVLVGTLAFHFSTIRGVLEANRELSAIAARFPVASADLLPRLGQLEETARKYRATGDLRYAGKFLEAAGGFENALRGVAALDLSEPEREVIRRLEEEWGLFRPLAARVGEDPPGGVPMGSLEAGLAGLREAARELNQASQSAMVAQVRSSAASAREAERLSWAAVGGALLLGLVVAVFIHRAITRPLGRLGRGMHAVAEGDFAHRLDVPRDDEFARLARDFNRMAARLGELDRAKSDFLSQISHDLKTPLASIQEANALLLDEIPGRLTARQRRLLELSRRSGVRLSSMISKLLDLSRMEAGTLEYELRPVDLTWVTRQAVEEFETRLAERDLRIETDLPPGEVVVTCDEDRIVQALHNLLENAVKFSPAGGRIDVSLRSVAAGALRDGDAGSVSAATGPGAAATGPGALLEVADEGPGVPPAQRERIFERFQQLEPGRQAAGGGVGLGLAVVRQILEAHGGAAWVAPAGGGSAFRLFLPVATREESREGTRAGPVERKERAAAAGPSSPAAGSAAPTAGART